MSHVVTNLSAMFPEGEDFFVRSVRNYREQITDPELKKQVAGFIGQEAMHGREHRSFNVRLGEIGYPTREVDRPDQVGHGAGGQGPAQGRSASPSPPPLEHSATATLAEGCCFTG